MSTFNWLHLTDLHLGLHGQAPLWPNVREAFLENISRLHDRAGPWHAVFFTGDLVQSGKSAEFKQLEDVIFGPLWERLTSLGSKDAVLLTVPGNHDLERPDTKKPSAAVRQLLRRDGFSEIADEFWSDPTCEYRKVINESFINYSAWSNDQTKRRQTTIQPGILPGDFSTTLKFRPNNSSEFSIGIAGLNTTFLQLTGGDYTERLSCDVRQINVACGGDGAGWAKKHSACILLTHQGPSWLDKISRENSYVEINPAGRFSAHLFGHMHETAYRSTTYGGGKPIRHWQSSSLFGMEKYGEPPTSFLRQHGYSAGRIDFSSETPLIKFWPRCGIKDNSGWRFDPDHKSCVLIEGDGSTSPEPLNNSAFKADKPQTATAPSPTFRDNNGKREREANTAQKAFPNAIDDPRLSDYCAAVCAAHSHIRFVEIPFLKDVSDVELDNLYVETKFSHQQIHPDIPPAQWPKCLSAIEALQARRHVVLLGDPGSGKSTLISCLAWHLCRPLSGKNSPWSALLGGFVPLPIILRELNLKADLTWEGLVEAFLNHRIGKLLKTREHIEEILRSGRALILLDGLDEIGNLAVRRKLRDAVHTGMASFPDCRWILTSRVVGYVKVPFHIKVENSTTPELALDAEIIQIRQKTKRVRVAMAELFFMAPFDDHQIQQFSINWYTQHEKEHSLVSPAAQDFVSAIKENDGTQRLARIPYLLTLMALIHHKNARLPHGRTELYERIATAYLESIDVRRHLDQLPYSLAQKKRWLAEIAYRMQLRRAKKGDGSGQGEVLANHSEVAKWLQASMKESSAVASRNEAHILIEYFAQRSGLLLPRAEGKFSFMHLSLQEYFAACFLEPRLTASRFSPKEAKSEPTDDQLRVWANTEAWRETFVLLFELLSEKSTSETEAFLTHLFAKRLDSDFSGKEATAAGLLAELTTDPFVMVAAETRRQSRQQLWRWMFRQRRNEEGRMGFNPFRNNVIRSLVQESQGDLAKAWKVAGISRQELAKVKRLDLTACTVLSNLSPLVALKGLEHLSLRDCISVTDLTPITQLKSLRILDLQGCGAEPSAYSVVSELGNLKTLFIGRPIDSGILSTVRGLAELHLHYTPDSPTDLSPLAGLSDLHRLCIRGPVCISNELQRSPKKILSRGVMEALQAMDHAAPGELIRRRMVHRVKRKQVLPDGAPLPL